MTFFIFALNQNGARRNDVFNGFPFSSANPTFINVLLLIAIVDLFVTSPWESKLNDFSVSVLFLFIFSLLLRCYSAKM
jgi:hypothetical protein